MRSRRSRPSDPSRGRRRAAGLLARVGPGRIRAGHLGTASLCVGKDRVEGVGVGLTRTAEGRVLGDALHAAADEDLALAGLDGGKAIRIVWVELAQKRLIVAAGRPSSPAITAMTRAMLLPALPLGSAQPQ